MKQCIFCGNYNVYYTKGYKQFNREKSGYCSKHEKIVENRETCGHWRNNLTRRRLCKTVSLKQLFDLASNVAEITQILREEHECDKAGQTDM